jgi:uncharacterized protein YdaU (DUF1376 family)
MHYYQFNIADYRKDTVHLKPIEHYIYRTLIDWYYLDEDPIPHKTDVVLRKLCLSYDNEEHLLNVLSDFFDLKDDHWHHTRINEEIENYKSQLEQASRAGKASALARANKQNVNDRSTTVQPTNNHKPITNNHSKGTRLPKDWQPTAEFIDFCKSERPELNPDSVAQEFKDYWVSKAGADGVKLDWLATWRNWVRRQRQQTVVKESFGWRNDDTQIMKIASKLGVHTSGKSRFEILALIDKKRAAT